MFTGLVFKSLCTILLYVFIVPSSVDPFIEYAWENQQIIYVTEFAKRGLIHSLNFSNLRMCNSASVGPSAWKFGGTPFLSLY